MDIYCPICGEPWDHDELHDAHKVRAKLLTYDEISRLFAKVGCEALDAKHNETPDTEAAAFSRVVMSTSPHADDWASDLDDLM